MFGSKKRKEKLKELKEIEERMDRYAKMYLSEEEQEEIQRQVKEAEDEYNRRMRKNFLFAVYLISYVVVGIGLVLASMFYDGLDSITDWYFVIGNTGVLYFMIWSKEFYIKDNWGKLPFGLRTMWWLAFAFNIYTVLDRLYDMFIKGA